MLQFWSRIFGPVFAKEMIETARRKRYYFNRVLLLSVVLVVTWIAWEESANSFRSRNRSAIVTMSEVAQVIFTTTSVIQFGAIFLFVPVFVCGVIASERESRTLDLLFTTNLLDREIVLGKLASRLVLGLQLLFCVLPVISLIGLFGGVDPLMALGAYTAMFFAAIYAGAHAIYFSARSKSPLGAMVRTYWWMALWMLALPGIIIAILAEVTPSPTHPVAQTVLFLLAMVNPISSIFLSLVPEGYQLLCSFLAAGVPGGLSAWAPIIVFPLLLVIPFAWSCILVRLAVAGVRKEPAPLKLWPSRLNPLNAKRSGVTDQQWTAKLQQIKNPLVWRSCIAWVYDREGHIRRIQIGGWLVAYAFFFLLAFDSPRNLRDDEVAMGFLSCAWIGLGLLTVLVSATSLAGDRHRGFLDLVLMTPLTPAQIIGGTMRAVFRHVRIAYFLVLSLAASFYLFDNDAGIFLLFSLINGTLWMFLLILTGVVCSLTARTIHMPLIMTLVLPVFMTIGTPCFFVFEMDATPIAWTACLLFVLGTHVLVLHRLSTMTVGLHLTAMHFFLVSVATFWTFNGAQMEIPLLLANPGFHLTAILDGHPDRWFQSSGSWWQPIVAYSIAMVVNLLWTQRWVIRNFDRFADRIQQHDRPVSVERPPADHFTNGAIAVAKPALRS